MNKQESIIIETGEQPKYSIIWLHGLGADGHDFVPIVPDLNIPDNKPTRFIFPHAPVMPVTLNAGMAMRAWFDIHGLDFESKVDIEGIKKSVALMNQLIEQEHATGIAYKNIILAGFSQGGAIALYAGLRCKEKLAGILALSTFLPLAQTLQQEASAANQQTPIMMAHGNMDMLVNPMFAKASKTLLQNLGYDLSWHEYAMEHSVCPEELSDISTWLREKVFSA